MNLTPKERFSEKMRVLSDEGKLILSENTDIAPYSTFKIGGKADFTVKPNTKDALCATVKAARECGIKYTVIGNGSNVLFPDGRYDGALILTTSLANVTFDGNTVYAECGYSFTALASQAHRRGLTGLEFAYGIPGSVGGAVYMNAGAYDGEIKNVVTKTYWYDCDNDRFGEFCGDENEFGYRESVYQKNSYLILGAEFSLETGDKDAILEKMQGFMSARKEKQPLEYPSAGSTFKRAPGYFTAKLIDEVGMKGYSVGGAQVSEKHAGFVINKGGATADDVKRLVSDIQKAVYENSGVHIECEIRIIE